MLLYIDGHQRSDVLYDREERSLPKYFKYELRTYRWVQLKEEKAIELENSVQLPKAFYAYEREGEAMREYHVDTHKDLINFVHSKCYSGDLSVRIGINRPVLLVGQDETTFHQLSFSNQ